MLWDNKKFPIHTLLVNYSQTKFRSYMAHIVDINYGILFFREMLELEQTVRRIMATPTMSGRSILSL